MIHVYFNYVDFRNSVYFNYVDFCSKNGMTPVNAASFGKVVKFNDRQRETQITLSEF